MNRKAQRPLRGRPIWFQALLLMAVTAVFVAILCPIGWRLAGAAGCQAAGTAGGLCLFGALAALAITRFFSKIPGSQAFLTGFALSTFVRLGVPLGGGVLIHLSGGSLAEGGILYYLLVFYPITLAGETVLSLPDASGATDKQQDQQAEG